MNIFPSARSYIDRGLDGNTLSIKTQQASNDSAAAADATLCDDDNDDDDNYDAEEEVTYETMASKRYSRLN